MIDRRVGALAIWWLVALVGCNSVGPARGSRTGPAFRASLPYQEADGPPTSQPDLAPPDEAGRYGGQFPDDAFVTAGDFEGAIKLPGSDASVRIGGFVRAETSFDTDNAGTGFSTILPTIPLDGTPDDGTHQVQFHARNSRLNFDYRDAGSDRADFRVFVEFDFFGSGDDFGNGYELRLRHAAAEYGNLYVGQWWSNFTDIQSFPETSDLIGPLAIPTVRNPGIRLTHSAREGAIRAAVGLEDPAGDLSGDAEDLASDSIPNVTGYVEANGDALRVRLSGLALRLDSTTDEAWAGGLSLSGRWKLPYLHERDNLTFGLQGGSGFAHYYTGFTNRGLDGVVNGDGSIDPRDVTGAFVAYQHWWTDAVRSTVAWGSLAIDGPAGADGGDFEKGAKYIANVFWPVEERFTVGLELIHASLETVDGTEGDGMRFFLSMRFDL